MEEISQEELNTIGQEEVLNSEDVHEESEETTHDESDQIENSQEVPQEAFSSDDEEKKKKRRVDQLKRDKYWALNRVKQLEKENEDLRSANSFSNEAAMAHYDSAIQLRIEKAEKNYSHAREIGDVEGETRALREIARAEADAKSMEAWKLNSKYANQNTVAPSPQYQDHNVHEVEYNEDTNDWLDRNPWFVSGSSQYDPEMSQEVVSYAEALDRKYNRLGQPHKILSREYFNEIDNYVRHNFERETSQTPQKEIVMKPINNPVSPVGKRTTVPQRPNVKDIKLTDDERFMARNMGISEEDWKRAKLNDTQIQKQRGRI